MTILTFSAFALGAVAATIAVLILIPINLRELRPGGWPKAAAGAVLLVPVLVLVTVASGITGTAPSMPGTAPPVVQPVAETTQSSAADWASATRTFAGTAAGTTPPDDAIHAGLHAGAAAGTTRPAGNATERAQQSAAELQAVTQREPDNATAWLALAQSQRLARNYPAAVKAYETALKLEPRNADAWADYADALASANNRRLAGAPAAAIARALALDPRHLKGLWLAASLDLEQHHYSQALQRWQKLRAALPQGSPDTQVIDANIAEARQLAAQAGGA